LEQIKTFVSHVVVLNLAKEVLSVCFLKKVLSVCICIQLEVPHVLIKFREEILHIRSDDETKTCPIPIFVWSLFSYL